MVGVGFTQQGVKLHHSGEFIWPDMEKRLLGEPCPALLCPAPPRSRALAAAEMLRLLERGCTTETPVKCSVFTPTRNPQGFGPFSPLAGAEQVLQGGIQGQTGRTSLQDIPP